MQRHRFAAKRPKVLGFFNSFTQRVLQDSTHVVAHFRSQTTKHNRTDMELSPKTCGLRFS